jgi:hypothetical protein
MSRAPVTLQTKMRRQWGAAFEGNFFGGKAMAPSAGFRLSGWNNLNIVVAIVDGHGCPAKKKAV